MTLQFSIAGIQEGQKPGAGGPRFLGGLRGSEGRRWLRTGVIGNQWSHLDARFAAVSLVHCKAIGSSS